MTSRAAPARRPGRQQDQSPGRGLVTVIVPACQSVALALGAGELAAPSRPDLTERRRALCD